MAPALHVMEARERLRREEHHEQIKTDAQLPCGEDTAREKHRIRDTAREANATAYVKAGIVLGSGGAGDGEKWKNWYVSWRFYC